MSTWVRFFFFFNFPNENECLIVFFCSACILDNVMCVHVGGKEDGSVFCLCGVCVCLRLSRRVCYSCDV